MTPGIEDLSFTLRNGIKYFELVAEPVKQEILPGIFIKGWGYNGSIPGPTIKVCPGDYVNIRVYNCLPEPTSVHWHGLDVPVVMDGVPDVQPSPLIEPNHYFDYHFEIVNPPGTHMYHSHHNTAKQEMMGLAGGFIILDKDNSNIRDYFLIVQEFAVKGLKHGEIEEGYFEIDPLNDRASFFTINGRSFPYTLPLYTSLGDIVRVRFANPSAMEHPMHLHGHQFYVTALDGNSIREGCQLLRNTIPVASGETADIEFLSNNPGIWPLHCHIPHHMANNHTKETGGMITTVIYR